MLPYTQDAERALSEMNGEWLGSRAIRVNWANQKTLGQGSDGGQAPDLQAVLSQATPNNTTVYVGNLTPDVTDQLLRIVFQEFGPVEV